MFKIFIFLIMLVGSGFLSAQLYPQFGDVSVLIYQTKISLPLGLAISLLLAVGVSALVALRALWRVYLVAKRFMKVLGGRDNHLALLIYNKAMCEMALGNYELAQHLFIKGVGGSQEPLLNYLQAAQCAQLRHDYLARDKMMMVCYKKFIDFSSLINFQYALMCYAAGDCEKSLALLLAVDNNSVNHDEYLKLKANLLFKMASYPKLLELLPRLTKHHLLASEDLHAMHIAANTYALQQDLSLQELNGLWQDLPRNLRLSYELVAVYVKRLSSLNLEQAESVLRKSIDSQYNPDLVELYGKTESLSLSKQIGFAENWYKSQPTDYALNLCLGRLCTKHKLWGKAKTYLEKSLALNPTQEAFLQYAKLCSAMGDQTSKLEVIDRSLKFLDHSI